MIAPEEKERRRRSSSVAFVVTNRSAENGFLKRTRKHFGRVVFHCGGHCLAYRQRKIQTVVVFLSARLRTMSLSPEEMFYLATGLLDMNSWAGHAKSRAEQSGARCVNNNERTRTNCAGMYRLAFFSFIIPFCPVVCVLRFRRRRRERPFCQLNESS